MCDLQPEPLIETGILTPTCKRQCKDKIREYMSCLYECNKLLINFDNYYYYSDCDVNLLTQVTADCPLFNSPLGRAGRTAGRASRSKLFGV